MDGDGRIPWKTALELLDGKVVTIKCKPISGFWSGMTIPVYFVEVEENPDFTVCIDWLHPPKNCKIPCNCPLNQILSIGCKNPNHI
jgi:hypothetical protein